MDIRKLSLCERHTNNYQTRLKLLLCHNIVCRPCSSAPTDSNMTCSAYSRALSVAMVFVCAAIVTKTGVITMQDNMHCEIFIFCAVVQC